MIEDINLDEVFDDSLTKILQVNDVNIIKKFTISTWKLHKGIVYDVELKIRRTR